MFTYPTPSTARPFWRDMPGNEAEASLYLEVAKGQCLAYAPLPAEPAPTYTPFTTTNGGVTFTFSRVGEIVTVEMVSNGTYGEVYRDAIPEALRWVDLVDVYLDGFYLSYYSSTEAFISMDVPHDPGTYSYRYLGPDVEGTGPVEIPANYFAAIVTQARNLHNAGVSPVGGGDFDGSGYGVTTFPLDWTVKQLLRPELGLGAIA
ncbi:hypothetical protein ACTJJ4_03050 [Microbacterium sp. 22195]|uniref:hypothetical protein n=1 Tax=Microbacterium sp. 22195 TaxID=3453891 RepID=UPI003F853692